MTLEALKTHTQPSHTQVEQVFSRLLFSRSLTPAGYLGILRCMARLTGELEEAFAGDALTAELYKGRVKQAWLKADIHDVCNDFALRDMPPPVFSAPVGPGTLNRHQLVGAMYVLEGSTLGGRIIARHMVQAHPWMQPERHLRYFQSYGAGRDQRWSDFKASLNAHLQRYPQCFAEIEQGATATFTQYQHLLRQLESGPANDTAPRNPR
ncbi:biliverdin-producing heme oxygenase [uncultured Gilvimarinus sp.]|uniref:biliverdin-producing heme oxygenase n=1 Tax=uncultured Gilvimarinus sp. TaxID=1689143 RepID=UPI0030ECD9C7